MNFFIMKIQFILCVEVDQLQVQLQDHQFMFSEILPEMISEQENRQLKEAQTCKICMDKEVRILFLLYFLF